MVYILLFSWWLGWSQMMPTQLHEFHLSKSLVNYNAQTKAVEVSLHIFIDDLELAIKGKGKDSLYIATTKEASDADKYIADYVVDQFKVYFEGKELPLTYLGKEVSSDLMAIWCYLEAEQISAPKEVTLINTLLTELYEDQRNLITFTAPRVEKYFLFDKKKNSSTINLD
jgi:hypothetical protein